MEVGRLGIYRESMDENPLLMKSELGRSLKRCFTLPNDTFVYGRPNLNFDGGAAEAMTTKEAIPIYKKQEKALQRDFVALNRKAVASGLVTAKEHSHFRATNDICQRISHEDKMKILTRRIPPDMTFGISTRPSTPVFELLEHKYQDKWLTARREAELARQSKAMQQRSAHLETFRTPEKRLASFKHHQSDATSRRGMFGHGIYEAAKS